MARLKIALLLCAVLAVGGWAAESDGLTGTVGTEVMFLPGVATDLWVDLDWNVSGWSIGNLTTLTVFPAFAVSWTGSVGYSFASVDLGGALAIDIYPFAFESLDIHAAIGLLDIEQDTYTLSADASLFSDILPVFGTVLALDIDASYGIFAAWTDFDLGIPGFDVAILFGVEARVLGLDLENGSLTADLGASTALVPAFDAELWLDLGLVLGSVTVTAETAFSLTPFDLLQQEIRASIEFGAFTCYAWIEFTGAGAVSAGIGATYDVPGSSAASGNDQTAP